VLGLESSYGERYAFYDSAGWTPGYATIGHIPTQEDIDNGWRIVDILRASDRPAMSEEAAFSIRADKDVVTNPTQLKNLYENDLFDPANLVAAIQTQDFGVIVFRAQFYPPPVLAAVYEAYYPAGIIPMNGFDYEIWRPGPTLSEREAFAAHLDAVAPGDTITQALAFPFENAPRWLDHALTHLNWQLREDGGTSPGADADCVSRTYQRDEITLRTVLCPLDSGTELTLTEEAE
jgi:hypothetical protein